MCCNTERLLQGADVVTAAMDQNHCAREPVPGLRDERSQRRVKLRATTDLEHTCHAGSPSVSSSPSMRLAFCTAWPAAPFMRLSIAERINRAGRRTDASGMTATRTTLRCATS